MTDLRDPDHDQAAHAGHDQAAHAGHDPAAQAGHDPAAHAGHDSQPTPVTTWPPMVGTATESAPVRTAGTC